MAAKDISLVGATFYAVPQVDLPISGGGTASFVEISDTTATAADVASGKYFYTAAGVKTEGTASGGSANIQELNVTQNGTYTASGGVDGYSPVIVNVSGGGGDSWSWMGKNPTKIATRGDSKVYLKDTGFNTWTPSTTATTITAAGSETFTSLDIANYDYVVLDRFYSHLEYGSGATGRNEAKENYRCGAVDVFGYFSNYANLNAYTSNGYTSLVPSPYIGLLYIASNGNLTYGSYGYGIYANSAPSISSLSATGFTISTPAVMARCSSTYFSTANAGQVDKNASYYIRRIDLWRVDKHTSIAGNSYKEIHSMFTNGGIS